MPNGRLRPEAKISTASALAPSGEGRSTRTRPAALSATKISPFGAARSSRGLSRSLANSLISKPAGTSAAWPRQFLSTLGGLRAEVVA